MAFSVKRKLDVLQPKEKCAKKVALSGPSTKMKVYVRVRPYNSKEQQSNSSRSVVKILDDYVLVFDPKVDDQPFFFHGVKQRMRDITKKENKEMQFLFDRVYAECSTNEDVYEGSIKDLLPSLLNGFNCSVFVYGATGAGKTFTMVGNHENPGITYLTMLELYKQMETLKETKTFKLCISYLEVYNENVHDLLTDKPKSAPLHLREDTKNGVVVAGCKWECVNTADELLGLLQQGNQKRTQHPTDANAESSRSHAVFQVFIEMRNKDSEQMNLAKLTMIDLAGSERGAATNCRGMRFKEGSNINKSLLALGNCINNLADGVPHIPYRDSKLTRLLKDSLGGNCQTVMVACVGPTNLSYEDTYNTLKYATRAKNIKNVLSKNVRAIDTHVENYKNIVHELQRKISGLEGKVKLLENQKIAIESKQKLTEHQKIASLENQVITLENKLKIQENDKSNTVSAPSNLDSWKLKIDQLYEEKRRIQSELLRIESSKKQQEWKIRLKENISNRINDQQPQLDNDNNAAQQQLEKIENSKIWLQGGINGCCKRMNELWEQNVEICEKIRLLREGIVKNGLEDFLLSYIKLKEESIARENAEYYIKHLERIFNLLDIDYFKELDLICDLSRQNEQYCALLRATNKLTNAMSKEHEGVRNKIIQKGIRNVVFDQSPSNPINQNKKELKPYCSLSINELQNCIKPKWLQIIASSSNKDDDEIRITTSDDADDETDSEKENATFVIGTDGNGSSVAPRINQATGSATLKPKCKYTPVRKSLSKAKTKPFLGTKAVCCSPHVRHKTPFKVPKLRK